MTAISASSPMPMSTASASTIRPVSLARVTRAEWIKLRTIRSSFVLIGMTALLIVGVWALTSTGFVLDPAGGEFPESAGLLLNPYSVGLTVAVGLAQLAAGVLGVVFVTNEYATGMIR